jgi:heme/copper-type cytochrome/quinol oxidase subunit 2
MAKNQPASKQPYGPGLLMIYGLALLALAAYCAYDLLGGTAEEWRAQGKEWYVTLNWVIMIVAILAAIYAWVLAAIRSKKGVGTPTDARGPAKNRPKKS